MIRTNYSIDSATRRVTFYAAVFRQPTRIIEKVGGKLRQYNEAILPGAFARSLAAGHDITANIGHLERMTFASRSAGELLLAEDPHGLFATTWLPDTPAGNLALERIKSGELDAASFKFVPIKDQVIDGLVLREEVDLEHVTLCNHKVAGYDGTSVELRVDMIPRQITAKFDYEKARVKHLTKSFQ